VAFAPAFAAPLRGALGGRPAAFGGGFLLFVPLELPCVPFPTTNFIAVCSACRPLVSAAATNLPPQPTSTLLVARRLGVCSVYRPLVFFSGRCAFGLRPFAASSGQPASRQRAA